MLRSKCRNPSGFAAVEGHNFACNFVSGFEPAKDQQVIICLPGFRICLCMVMGIGHSDTKTDGQAILDEKMEVRSTSREKGETMTTWEQSEVEALIPRPIMDVLPVGAVHITHVRALH